MALQISVPFGPSAQRSFFEVFPSRPAVFALFLKGPTDAESLPYLSRATDLRRRLTHLLDQPALGKPIGSPDRGFTARSKRLNLREVTRRIDYQCVGSNFEARWLLYRFNRFYYPQNYQQRLHLKPPALLKLNLNNPFPRCYPTRRLSNDGSLYYGPFPSRAAAESFAAEFLDLFKIRRCVEDLNPNPAHPGCIYSQMHMCLAPCFQGCTDDEYKLEVGRVVSFLDSEGQSLVRVLEAERAQASDVLDFEQATKVHRKLEKVHAVLRLKPGLARNLTELNAMIVQRGREPKTVAFFRVSGGALRGPVMLSLEEKVSSPIPLDHQIRTLLEPLEAEGRLERPPESDPVPDRLDATAEASSLPPWEHLSFLARWYYSSFREGELVMLARNQEIPHARLIRVCRKILAAGQEEGGKQ